MVTGAVATVGRLDGLVSAQGDSGELTGIAGWAVNVIDALGAVGVGLLVALENVFPPIPSEVILPLAGYAASQGKMNLVAGVAAATAGSIVGALLLYWLGASFGHDRVRGWAERIPLVEAGDLDKAEYWFRRHGSHAVLIGRCVPVVRSLISIPAGIERIPLPQFVLYTAIGSGVWNTLFVVAGHQLGRRWKSIGTYSEILNWVILAVIAALIVLFVVRRLRDRSST
jgi:membrane protein DedA with SNARE-associated domain